MEMELHQKISINYKCHLHDQIFKHISINQDVEQDFLRPMCQLCFSNSNIKEEDIIYLSQGVQDIKEEIQKIIKTEQQNNHSFYCNNNDLLNLQKLGKEFKILGEKCTGVYDSIQQSIIGFKKGVNHLSNLNKMCHNFPDLQNEQFEIHSYLDEIKNKTVIENKKIKFKELIELDDEQHQLQSYHYHLDKLKDRIQTSLDKAINISENIQQYQFPQFKFNQDQTLQKYVRVTGINQFKRTLTGGYVVTVMEPNVPTRKQISFKIQLNKASQDVIIGVCQRNTVQRYHYDFDQHRYQLGHGVYGINCNGFKYHSSDISVNMKKSGFQVKAGKSIQCTCDPIKGSLLFTNLEDDSSIEMEVPTQLDGFAPFVATSNMSTVVQEINQIF